MPFSRCKFCGENNLLSFPIVTRKKTLEYFQCENCGAISLLDKCFLSHEQQKERYVHHHNFLEDLGYAVFLATFLRDCFSFLPNYSPQIVLDYGCGPNPALIQLMQKVSARQRSGGEGGNIEGSGSVDFQQVASLEQLVDLLAVQLPPLPEPDCILGWDPFFAPGERMVPGTASLVLCLEVAEHFEEPLAGFHNLAACCAEGGYVAVGTLPIPDSMNIPEGFKGWWYKDDLTHVSFYTEKAMTACGAASGLEYLGKASPRIFLFRKQGDA